MNQAAAVFRSVSVVQIASDNSANERAEGRRNRAMTGRARRILSSGSGTPMTPVEHTNNSCGAQPIRFAASATVRTAAAWPAAPVAQLALPAFTTTARMRPFEVRKCSLEMRTGAATTRFCVKTAAADAGTSLEKRPRSSAPVFFKPQAVAAKRNPRGKDASGRAALIFIDLLLPLERAAFVALARRSTKQPPVSRGRCESVLMICDLRTHDFAPFFLAFLLRRSS